MLSLTYSLITHEKLRNIDDYSKYIIQVQISDDEDARIANKFNRSFLNLGSTMEKQGTGKSIDFENSFVFPYFFELEQVLRFKIIKNNNSKRSKGLVHVLS